MAHLPLRQKGESNSRNPSRTLQRDSRASPSPYEDGGGGNRGASVIVKAESSGEDLWVTGAHHSYAFLNSQVE